MNSSKPLGVRLAVLGAALVIASALGVRPAGAAMSEAEVSRMIENTYGVQVLRVRAERLGEDLVWLVTVMNPPGDFNEAFQVNTLAVNQETGALIPTFRHGPSGIDLPGSSGRGDKVGLRPDAGRSGAWR
jgi:hypothetical protein